MRVGLFYFSVTVRGLTQDQVLRYLENQGRAALVSVTIDTITTIFDEEFRRGGVVWKRFEHPELYERGATVWEPFVIGLSHHFHCPALAVEVYDNDILYYQLYDDGRITDEYSSALDYFGTFSGTRVARFGMPEDLMLLFRTDHAAHLCAAFASDDVVPNEVTQILDDRASYGQEQYRHWALVPALGLPTFARYMGYGAASANKDADFGQGRKPGFVPTS